MITLGQQSWFIGSLRTPNIFVYSCFFVRRRASPKPPKASPKLPKASQSIRRVSQSLPETKKREKGSYSHRIESTKNGKLADRIRCKYRLFLEIGRANRNLIFGALFCWILFGANVIKELIRRECHFQILFGENAQKCENKSKNQYTKAVQFRVQNHQDSIR